MSYAMTIDEYSDQQLEAEHARRLKLAQDGLCTYCGKGSHAPLCRFPERHPKPAAPQSDIDRAIGLVQAYHDSCSPGGERRIACGFLLAQLRKLKAEPKIYVTFLDRLRATNITRMQRWHGPDAEPWTGADWSNAMGGECGEAQNVVKKLRRLETGTGGGESTDHDQLCVRLGEELADTIIYADLLAAHYDIDLTEAIVLKFNAISEREGFPERMSR